jgi:hypothetical protein
VVLPLRWADKYEPTGNTIRIEILCSRPSRRGHLVSLIDDVLDIAKIEGERLDLFLVALLMTEMLTGTVGLMMPVAASANVADHHERNSFAGFAADADRHRETLITDMCK